MIKTQQLTYYVCVSEIAVRGPSRCNVPGTICIIVLHITALMEAVVVHFCFIWMKLQHGFDGNNVRSTFNQQTCLKAKDYMYLYVYVQMIIWYISSYYTMILFNHDVVHTRQINLPFSSVNPSKNIIISSD